MRLHPRTPIVTKAELELDQCLLRLRAEYDLTTVETAQILNRISLAHLKFALRYERHPNDSIKGADEA